MEKLGTKHRECINLVCQIIFNFAAPDTPIKVVMIVVWDDEKQHWCAHGNRNKLDLEEYPVYVIPMDWEKITKDVPKPIKDNYKPKKVP